MNPGQFNQLMSEWKFDHHETSPETNNNNNSIYEYYIWLSHQYNVNILTAEVIVQIQAFVYFEQNI